MPSSATTRSVRSTRAITSGLRAGLDAPGRVSAARPLPCVRSSSSTAGALSPCAASRTRRARTSSAENPPLRVMNECDPTSVTPGSWTVDTLVVGRLRAERGADVRPECLEQLTETTSRDGGHRVLTPCRGCIHLRRRLVRLQHIELRDHHAMRLLRELVGVLPQLAAQQLVLRLRIGAVGGDQVGERTRALDVSQKAQAQTFALVRA